jgi:RNA polymerase sigma-32 factor
VYEDDHLIVVDKSAEMVVHPAAGNPDGTLVNALLHHCAGRLSGIGGVARPGIVHRIDKGTSGLLVVAKSDAAHEGLARQFADHSIERAYLAITHGVPMPTQGTLKGMIGRHHTDRKRMAIMPEEPVRYVAPYEARDETEEPSHRGKHAVTHYRLREGMGKTALVECRLETGRTHQVRVHMASIGHPLVGDPVYCRSQKSLKPLLSELNFTRQSLHAAVLGFIHPVTGKTLRFASDLPADMRDLLARLGSFHADQPGFSCRNRLLRPARGRRRRMPVKGPSRADRRETRTMRPMSNESNLPAIPSAPTGEAGLNRYMSEIKKFPMLTAEQEYMLAKRYAEHQDPDAARQLVTSHLRLVAKIAMGYRGYGLPVSELISEGNIGLMQGVKKFEPERGFRLATYAMWWIKASMQEFILRSWSLVKMGTTAAQKKLFFNLRRMKKNIDAFEDTDLHPDDVKKIATDLGVSEQDVVNMNRRMMMGGDASLNVSLNEEGEGQWQDMLADGGPLQDETVADAQEATWRHAMLTEAMADLNDRERAILIERRLTDEPKTLEELSQTYSVSRERVRQIEVRAFEKLQKAMQKIAGDRHLLPAG